LVFVPHQEAVLLTPPATFGPPRSDFDSVGLLPLARVPRRAGTAPVDIRLQVAFREREPRRTPVDDRTERGPVTLAERRDCEQDTESVAGHEALQSLG